MTRQDLIQLRANMLGGMNEYVKCFNDVCILFGKLIKAYGNDLWVKK